MVPGRNPARLDRTDRPDPGYHSGGRVMAGYVLQAVLIVRTTLGDVAFVDPDAAALFFQAALKAGRSPSMDKATLGKGGDVLAVLIDSLSQ